MSPHRTPLRSALTSNGGSTPSGGRRGRSSQARHDKESTYPEIATSGRCKLVVLAIETGGRWSEEAVQIVRMLAFAEAQQVPSNMQFLVALMWERRWTRMLPITWCPSPRCLRRFVVFLGATRVEHVWALGLSCETPAPSGPPGLHTTTRELQMCICDSPGASNTTNISREDPQRETKKAKMGPLGRGKKSAKFWAPHPSGPHPSGAPPFRPHLSGPSSMFILSRLSLFILSRMLFFCPVCVFLSRMHLFILSPVSVFFPVAMFFCPNTLRSGSLT